MSEWLELEKFLEHYHCSKQEVLKLAKDGKVEFKKQEGVFYVRDKGVPMAKKQNEVIPESMSAILQSILEMQNRYNVAKDEIALVYKNENAFLRSMLANMQEIHRQDRKMVEYLQKELEKLQESYAMLQKKYQFLWDSIRERNEG